ncbi:metallopeptidase family protein [Candidatus Uhrbacteria bacterium]|nr:metallopeptidase family protein [Candidatus Uhrbacteria bacterium]
MDSSSRVFERLVAEAINEIPERFRERLRNVAVVVEEEPTEEQLRECEIPEDETMYAYYDGVALTERYDGEPVVPDRIIIFRQPFEEDFGDDERALRDEIATTIRHEVAHHFGIDDDRLEEMGKY